MDFNNAFLTIKEVQHCLRVSEPTALKIIHAEGFPKLTGIGKRLLIPKQAFQQWCIDNTTYEVSEIYKNYLLEVIRNEKR